jgi:signal transduction histidine kinase
MPRREPVDLARLARAIDAQLRAGSPARRVELTVDEPLQARADPALLEHALGRLLEMSWELTRARPVAHIHIGALAGPDGTAYFIRDDGLGAADADDPDLAAVAEIVRAHGGRFWTESAPGAGATIYFTLGG